MLAVAKPLLLFLILFLIINVEACNPPVEKEPQRCCHEIMQDYCFDHRYGLFTKTPQCPDTFSPTFTLVTRTSPFGVPISRENIPSEFSNNRRTVIIVPGWVESLSSKYTSLIRELLTREDCNVIFVDWKKGTDASAYTQSTENTETMGAYLGSLVNILRNQPGSKTKFWCIGNGMGAHVCGYTHLIASPRLERITGVNPNALVYNLEGQGLKKGDANNVDVIHTDSNWGSNKPRGDVDFYPNGGTGQPGCSFDFISLPSEAFRLKIANGGPVTCDHARALEYMIHSINSPTCYIATHICRDYENLDTSCSVMSFDSLGIMGYEAENYRYEGILYYKANDNDPHCSNNPFQGVAGLPPRG